MVDNIDSEPILPAPKELSSADIRTRMDERLRRITSVEDPRYRALLDHLKLLEKRKDSKEVKRLRASIEVKIAQDDDYKTAFADLDHDRVELELALGEELKIMPEFAQTEVLKNFRQLKDWGDHVIKETAAGSTDL